RGVLYAAAAIVLLLVVAAGGYVWYVMNSLTPTTRPLAAGIVAPPRAPASSPAAPPAPLPAAPAAQAPSGETNAPATPAPTPPAPVSDGAQRPAAAAPAPVTREELVRQLLREGGAEREPPLRLEPSQEAPRVPGEISAGYAALAGGDLGAARRAYEAALS